MGIFLSKFSKLFFFLSGESQALFWVGVSSSGARKPQHDGAGPGACLTMSSLKQVF